MAAASGPSHVKALLKSESRPLILYAVSTFINRFGAFLLLPFYWQRLSVADYGIIAVVDIIQGVLGVVQGLSLDVSLTRTYHEWSDAERKRRLGGIWVVGWGSIVLVNLLALLILPRVSPYLFPAVPFDPYLELGILFILFNNLANIPLRMLRIQQRVMLVVTLSLSTFVVSSALGLWYVLVMDRGVEGFLLARVWNGLLFALVFVAIMAREATPCVRNSGIREQLRFSLPLIKSTALSKLASSMEQGILQGFAGLEALGLFSLAAKFAGIISGVHTSIKMSFQPFQMKAIAREGAVGVEKVSQITPYYVFLYFSAFVFIGIFLGEAIHLIGRSEYYPVIVYVPYLMVVEIMAVMYTYYGSGVLLAKRTDLAWIPSAWQLGTLILAGWALVYFLNLWGIILSRNLQSLVYLLVAVWYSRRVFPMVQRWGAFVFMAAGALAAVGLFQWLAPTTPLATLGWGVLLWGGYSALVILIPLRGGREALKRWRGRKTAGG